MKGKNKCKILKQIRQKIADENDIPYVTRECTFQRECRGICPKCEAELRYLEEELEKRRALGKKVAVAAVAVGLTASLSACVSRGTGSGATQPTTAPTTETAEPLQGEIAVLPSESADPAPLLGRMETDPSESTEEYTELAGDVVFLPESPETTR